MQANKLFAQKLKEKEAAEKAARTSQHYKCARCQFNSAKDVSSNKSTYEPKPRYIYLCNSMYDNISTITP